MIIIYLVDVLFFLLAAFMFYFSYVLVRYIPRNSDSPSPSRPKIWPLLLALLIIPFSLWLTVIAWQQPLTVMSSVKGAAHGWVVGLLSLSCAGLFALLAFSQLKYMLRWKP